MMYSLVGLAIKEERDKAEEDTIMLSMNQDAQRETRRQAELLEKNRQQRVSEI